MVGNIFIFCISPFLLIFLNGLTRYKCHIALSFGVEKYHPCKSQLWNQFHFFPVSGSIYHINSSLFSVGLVLIPMFVFTVFSDHTLLGANSNYTWPLSNKISWWSISNLWREVHNCVTPFCLFVWIFLSMS